MKINVEITNISELLDAAEVVTKKAEELQEAVQRLNAIELKISMSQEE